MQGESACTCATRQHGLLPHAIAFVMPCAEIKDLEETLNRVPADAVLVATPIDLGHLVKLNKPYTRVRSGPTHLPDAHCITRLKLHAPWQHICILARVAVAPCAATQCPGKVLYIFTERPPMAMPCMSRYAIRDRPDSPHKLSEFVERFIQEKLPAKAREQ